MKALLAVVVVVSVGCSGPNPPRVIDVDARTDSDSGVGDDGGNGRGDLELHRSGSRIKMRMLTTPDGAKLFQGSFDSERNEDCHFRIASDGATRCLPTAMIPLEQNTHFEDEFCTVPVAIVLSCLLTPRYISKSVAQSCSALPGTAVFPAVAASGVRSTMLSSGCQSAALPPNSTAYRIAGPELPPTRFQSGTSTIE